MPFEIPNRQDIPPGTYTGVLAQVEEVAEGQFGAFRKWHWLIDIDGKTAEVSQTTSMNTGPQSKSYAQLTALLGRAPQAGEKLDDPTGKRVILTIGRNDKGFPTIEAVGPYAEPQQTLPGVPR